MRVDDVVCGSIDFDLTNPETHPDMTIRRPDGSWIFHFVNVVDDIEMKISHVIRGEDHLSNTPKHIELYRALGAEPPRFAHIPLILNKDGSKMSKRDVGASLNSYIEEGFLPEAVRNYLRLLGWSPKDDREKLELEEVISLFELEKINRKSAHFDLEKCTWLNGEYARELPASALQARAPRARARRNRSFEVRRQYVRAALDTCVGKLRTFAELPAYCGFYFRDDFASTRKASRSISRPRTSRASRFCARPLLKQILRCGHARATLKATAARARLKVGALVHPMRLAVTGSNAGPSLYHLLEVLGKEKVLARIDRALAHESFGA